jgi:hypothetical protein
MPRRKWDTMGLRFMGRKRTAPRQSWRKVEWIDGQLCDVTPEPGRTFTRDTWPPRGRGRGESLTSPRRISAKLRVVKVIRMRADGLTFEQIARKLGYRDASGPYRAMKRTMDRVDWDRDRKQALKRRG